GCSTEASSRKISPIATPSTRAMEIFTINGASMYPRQIVFTLCRIVSRRHRSESLCGTRWYHRRDSKLLAERKLRMKTTTLGKTGLEVSRIAYGTWQPGGEW